jgi:hypothetical protein
MGTMAQSGSLAAYSSARGRGSTGRNTSTDTSIIISTIAMATMVHYRHAGNAQWSIRMQNSVAGQCMTRMGVKRPGTGKQLCLPISEKTF